MPDRRSRALAAVTLAWLGVAACQRWATDCPDLSGQACSALDLPDSSLQATCDECGITYVCFESGDNDGGPAFRLIRFAEYPEMCACVDRWGDIDLKCAEDLYDDYDDDYDGDYRP